MKPHYTLLHWLAFLASCSFFWTTARAQSIPPDSVRHRLILIGDAGRLRAGKNPVVDAVSARYDFDNRRTTLLYLGDNLYTYGLPNSSDPGYSGLAEILRYQANPGLAKQSRVLFIPGNHDWAQGRPDGLERIRQQGHWIDSLNTPNIRLLPADGCPGPEEIPLSDRLVLVIMDSQWWLHPHDKPGANSSDSDCACKTEDEVLARLGDIARRNKDKTLIFAAHHPFRSYGVHGGNFGLKQHLFPLTEFSHNLYVPLPIIGSLYPLIRGVFGNIQDLRHPDYKQMVRAVETVLKPAPNVLFVAGHDHNQQYIVDGNRPYIVSGAGINRERIKSGRKARFVSSDWGYVVLDETTTGRLIATFYTVDESAQATQAHQATIFTQPPTQPDSEQAVSARPTFPDSVDVAIAPAYDSVGRTHRWLLGKNYRHIWATPVRFPVFDLNRTNGGYSILQRGGGMQTKSLRLADSTGREWVLRSVQKDPVSALPAPLRQTIAKDIVQDEISAGFPYGPLVVPPLANAIGVPHATPTLVYIPDDPALRAYRTDFSQSVGLLEEREPGAGKTVSTAKVREALEADNDNRVDERAVLRARLLDLLIGDWDRHEDQWRWGVRKAGKGNEYYPIPRDRDQVFFRADGLLPTIAALPWLQPKFQGFSPRLANVNGAMYNARYFDRMFLIELNAQDWLDVINSVQTALTDSVLQAGINRFPAPVRQQAGDRLFNTLQARRNALRDWGMKYYEFLAKAVDIPGSDKTELFRVESRTDEVTVTVYKITKEGAVGPQRYQRVFNSSATNEIRLYGQKGDDRFEVNSTAKSPILIRIIGGKGDDIFTVNNQPGKVLIYDQTGKENTLPAPGMARLMLSPNKAVNLYDPHAFRYDRFAPLLSAGFNIDDGVLLGAGFQWTKQGFRKTPFAVRHRLMVSRALATEALSLKYDGMFTQLIGRNDLWVNASVRAPNNVANFFGLGNETEFDRTRRIRYYRTRYNLVTVSALLKRPLAQHISASVGPVFQYFNLDPDDNRGRFIERYLAQLPEPSQFLRHESYGGVQAGLLIDTRDRAIQPTNGIYWNTTLLGMRGFAEVSNHLVQVQSDLSVFTRLGTADRFVLANRIGGGLSYGNPAFYQLLYLGGHDNLRGLRQYRFAGNHLAYYNLEARLKLFSFQSYLFPGSVGLVAFNDVGRVWLRGESSRRWHHGYGGGLYVTPASLLVATVSLAFSEEGVLPYFSLGFRF